MMFRSGGGEGGERILYHGSGYPKHTGSSRAIIYYPQSVKTKRGIYISVSGYRMELYTG